MAKDPAVLFYTSDFLTGTFTMTDEQTGRYIKLLCLQHQKGSLTLSDLNFVCKGEDEVVFSKFDKNDDGTYINKAMAEHASKRKAYSDSRKNNRIKKDINKICYSYDNDMENVIVNENVNEIEIEKIIVLLTVEESEKLKNEIGLNAFNGVVKILLDYGINKPKKFKEYSSHYMTIKKWCIDAYNDSINKNNGKVNQASKIEKSINEVKEGSELIKKMYNAGN